MIKSIISLTALPLLVSACGSVQSQNQLYQTFNSSAAVTSPLVGRARNVGAVVTVTSALSSEDVTGTINHATGETTIGTVTDTDGLSANGVLVDSSLATGGPNVAEVSLSPITNNTLDFVRSYTVAGIFGAQQEGFIGIATTLTDMPTGNTSATYTGEASGQAANGLWSNAPATVTANFGTGTLDINASQTVGGVPSSVTVTGAQIAGNQITGGTLTATRNGAAVDVTSTNVQSFPPNIDGYFYGYDNSISAPDEIAVEIGAIGIDGTVDLRVFAD